MVHISDLTYMDLLRVGTARLHRDISYLDTWKRRYLYLSTSQVQDPVGCKKILDLARLTLDNDPKLVKGGSTYYNKAELAEYGMVLKNGHPVVVDPIKASRAAKARRDGLEAYRKRKEQEKEADDNLVKEAEKIFGAESQPQQQSLT